jgi:hypothetical protein
MNKFSESTERKLVFGADANTAALVTAYVPAKDFRRFYAAAQVGTLGAGKICRVRLLQATDSGGTGAKVLGTAVSGIAVDQECDANVSDMDVAGGFTHVAAEVYTDKTSTGGAAVLIADKERYSA